MRVAVYFRAGQRLVSEQASMPRTRDGELVGAVRRSGVFDADVSCAMIDSSRLVTRKVCFGDFTRHFDSLESDRNACKMTLLP